MSLPLSIGELAMNLEFVRSFAWRFDKIVFYREMSHREMFRVRLEKPIPIFMICRPSVANGRVYSLLSI